MANYTQYVVKKGDTLSGIAKKIGNKITWQKIYAANRDILNNPNRIYPGQALKIPTLSKSSGIAQTAGAAGASGSYTEYIVKSGDSLSKIAKNVTGGKLTWQQIFAANRDTIRDPNTIYAGQVIRIPANGSTIKQVVQQTQQSDYSTYTVVKGDTLSGIALKVTQGRVSWQQIFAA